MPDFEAIYEQYAPKIFRICMGYVNDHEQAKDITQDIFIAVWKSLPSFRGEANISTWIYRIATNNCLQAIRKAKINVTSDLPYQLPMPIEEPKEEKLNLLYNCIATLEETERIIISLILEDVPQAEITAITGLSAGNVRVKIYRIKEKLTAKFKQHGQFE